MGISSCSAASSPALHRCKSCVTSPRTMSSENLSFYWYVPDSGRATMRCSEAPPHVELDGALVWRSGRRGPMRLPRVIEITRSDRLPDDSEAGCEADPSYTKQER